MVPANAVEGAEAVGDVDRLVADAAEIAGSESGEQFKGLVRTQMSGDSRRRRIGRRRRDLGTI